MIHNPIISIIIPTYNVESYIARCLDSCINQTLGDIEILVINDCGSDDSISIAKTYASKDSRIRIIHNPTNLGLFATRITGEKEAQGTYILHLDADDYLTLNACERAYQKASMALNSTPLSSNTQSHSEQEEKNLPDIIHFHPAYRGSSQASLSANCLHKLRYILPTRFSHKPLQNEQIAYNFFLKSAQFPKFTLWDKCYKTSLIRQILPFMECFIPLKLTMAEDMLKFFAISALAKSYVSLDERLYIYCLNHSSITQNIKAKDKKIADMCYISEALHSLGNELETYNPLMPFLSQVMVKKLAALIILESRFLDNEGGGRNYTCTTSIPYRICPYSITKDSEIYSLYPLTLCALLLTFLAILESLSYLYSLNRISFKLYSYQALNSFYHLFARRIYAA